MGSCEPLEVSLATSWAELLLDEGALINNYRICSEQNELKKQALIQFMSKKR